jgi:ABC-2 type transport system permease protein
MPRTSNSLGTWRFARALFITNVRAGLAERWAFAMQVVFMVINNVVFFTFWWVLLARVPTIRGWTIAEVEALYGIVAVGFGVVAAFTGGVRFLNRTIEEGELDALLTQPKPTLLYATGMRSQASGFGDIVSGTAFLAASGYLTWTTAPIVALCVLSTATMFLSAGVIFFSLAFWMNRTEAVSRQLWELLLTFSLYPEPLFGGGLRLVLYSLLPAGFVAYLPARVLLHPSVGAVVAMIGAALLYFVIAAALFQIGLKRYSSGSRFSTLR